MAEDLLFLSVGKNIVEHSIKAEQTEKKSTEQLAEIEGTETTWKAVNHSLREGYRGLQGKLSLMKLRKKMLML